jgi:dipeptidase E
LGRLCRGNEEAMVRLYLSSFRMGDRFGELVQALPPGAPVAVISNAVDFIPMDARLAYARTAFDPAAHFRAHGLAAREVDLRAYFGRPDRLQAELEDVRLVWANGGNAFLLMKAMQQSGLDDLLRERVSSGELIYGGWSAGAVVAGATLRGLHLMDDPEVSVEGYAPEPVWDGLGLIDLTIVPHFESDHPESKAASEVVAWLIKEGEAFRALRDGEAIVV